MADFETVHDALDHTGLTGVGGGGLVHTPTTLEALVNSSTATGVARTLSGASSVLPADAVLATGFLQINVNAAPNSSNWLAVFHQDTDNEYASIARSGIASGITLDVPFTVTIVHSTGRKIRYQVSRASGTVTYVVNVTGYWAPA